MKSNLIKDTTKEERIALIKAWIPDDDGLQDCDMDLWDIYADYINGKREIAEINAQMTGTFYTEEDLNHWENVDTIRYTKSLHGDDRIMQYTPRNILNYVYEKEGVRHKKIMRYSSLPQDKIFTWNEAGRFHKGQYILCLLYTSPSPRD